MAFATRTHLQALQALAAACTGVQEAVLGIPESVGVQRRVAVSVLDGPLSTPSMGLARADQSYLVLWATALGGEEGQAELDLADFKDDFRRRFLAARKPGVGQTLPANTTLRDDVATTPEYLQYAGQEVREYPMVVTVAMDENLP